MTVGVSRFATLNKKPMIAATIIGETSASRAAFRLDCVWRVPSHTDNKVPKNMIVTISTPARSSASSPKANTQMAKPAFPTLPYALDMTVALIALPRKPNTGDKTAPATPAARTLATPATTSLAAVSASNVVVEKMLNTNAGHRIQ